MVICGLKWISVEERLPELDRGVLVYYGNLVRSYVYVAEMKRHYDSETREWMDDWVEGPSAIVTEDVTHWMPLPDPPSERDEK